MTPTDEELMAFADGELNEEDQARIARLIEADADLAAIVASHRALRAAAGAAFVTPEPETMSAGLAGLVDRISSQVETPAPSNVASFGTARRKRARKISRIAWPAAAAACFTVGVMTSQVAMLQVASVDTYLIWNGDAPVASKTLATILDETPSGIVSGAVIVSASFTDDDGRFCRQFEIEHDTRTGAIACREGKTWELITMAVIPTQQEGDFRTAGSTVDPLTASIIAIGVKEKLSPSKEAELIDTGWKSAD